MESSARFIENVMIVQSFKSRIFLCVIRNGQRVGIPNKVKSVC